MKSQDVSAIIIIVILIELFMTHTVSALKARQNLGDLLNRVSLKHDQFIIERGGRPMAAVIPIEKFERMQEDARSFLSQAFRKNRAANPGASLAADAVLLDEAKHGSRKPRRRAA